MGQQRLPACGKVEAASLFRLPLKLEGGRPYTVPSSSWLRHPVFPTLSTESRTSFVRLGQPWLESMRPAQHQVPEAGMFVSLRPPLLLPHACGFSFLCSELLVRKGAGRGLEPGWQPAAMSSPLVPWYWAREYQQSLPRFCRI